MTVVAVEPAPHTGRLLVTVAGPSPADAADRAVAAGHLDRAAGLIRREVVGREHYCHLEPRPLRRASAWLEHQRAFWEERLDALEQHIAARRKRDPRAAGRPAGGAAHPRRRS